MKAIKLKHLLKRSNVLFTYMSCDYAENCEHVNVVLNYLRKYSSQWVLKVNIVVKCGRLTKLWNP